MQSERERKDMAGIKKLANQRAKKANLHNKKLRDCKVHLNDEKADEEIEWIKSFIMVIRRIRSERDIPPGKELTVSTKSGTKKELEWLNKNELVIKMLGKIEKIVPTQDEVSDAALALAGEMTLLVPLADLINPQDEYNRICKMIENLEKEKMQLSAKLEN